MALIRQVLVTGMLRKEIEQYGVLHLNEKGNDFDAIEDDCLIASSAAISTELLKNL